MNQITAGADVAVPEKQFAVFRNTILNCRYTLKNGKDCIFYNGEFLTDNLGEIDELMEEIKSGHPFIFIDKNRLVVTKSDLDPLEQIKKKAIEEYKAQVAAAANAQTESTSDQKFNFASIATSANVGDAASGSTSVDSAGGTTAAIGGTATLAPQGGPSGTASLASLKAAAKN